MKRIISSKLGRSSKILKTAGYMGVLEISKKLTGDSQNQTVSQIQALVQLMGELKGAAMKVGQLLSLEAIDILPSELTEIFSKLQQDAPPLDFTLMQKILETEWKKKLAEIPIEVSSTPIASASIGQVHRGVYLKKPIAIKIQYPEIEKTIKNDLELIKNLILQYMVITGKKIDLKGFFDEIESTLLQETDYLEEKKSLLEFKHHLRHPLFKIPDVIEELSTQKVLTMSFEFGLPLKKWIDLPHDKNLKNQLAQSFLDLYLWEFLELKKVQTDPNFGNYLVQGEGDKIILLDFGSCKSYSKDFIQTYQEIIKATYDRRHQDLLKHSFDFELLSSKESPETQKLFIEMMESIILPFRDQSTIFEFKSQDYAQTTRIKSWAFGKSLRHSPPPRNLFFLHRKLGGLFGLMKKLEAELELKPFWEKMIESK